MILKETAAEMSRTLLQEDMEFQQKTQLAKQDISQQTKRQNGSLQEMTIWAGSKWIA